MQDRIRDVHHQVRSLSPAQAEVWFTVVVEQYAPTMEVRGRVVGPRCPSRTTIEISYPLQRIPYPPDGTPPLTMRVVIPDPSLWRPDAPYLYHAHLELWRDGERVSEKEFDLGLRTRT